MTKRNTAWNPTTGTQLNSRERAYAAANLAGWMETASCKNHARLWNAAENVTRAPGDLGSQHAAQAALELCLGCRAFHQCRMWATFDRYTGLAGGWLWTDGRPHDQRPPLPPPSRPPRLRDTRLLGATLHSASLGTSGHTQPPVNPRGEDSLLAEPKFAAYFLLPVSVVLPLDTDSSYAFIEDVNYLKYLSARRTDPNVDIDSLRRTAKKREASLWIHPIPSAAPDWKHLIRTALPWLPAAAVDAMSAISSPAAWLIEGCVPVDTQHPSESELQDGLDYMIGCIRCLQALGATERRHVRNFGRRSLPERLGVALAQLNGEQPPITGQTVAIRSGSRLSPALARGE